MSERESDWPPGWESVTIGEVVVVNVEQGALRTDFTYIDVGSVNNKTKQIDSAKNLAAGNKVPSRAQRHVQAGDILVSMTRPNLNAVAKVPTELHGAICSTGFDVLRPIKVEPDWLFLIVKSRPFVEAMTSLVQGALYPAVRPADIRAHKFALPPLAEQRRIAEKIEALQERSRRARDALSEVGPLLEQFRQSVLAGAFRGDLTADWRAAHPDVEPASEFLHRIRAERRRRWEQAELAKYEAKGQTPPKNWQAKYEEPAPVDDTDLPELPKGWCWASVDIVSEVVRGASPRPAGDPKYFDGDHTPWITVQEITKDDEIYLTSTATSLTEAGRAASRFIPSGTLLLTNSGATLGVPKITKIRGCINDGSVAIISVSGQFQLYLYFYLRSLTESLRRINQGAAQPNLNTDIVRQITVPIATATEQKEIIKRLNIALSTYRSLKREIPELTAEIDLLDQSLLAKAFRGELVPQDASDEPASVLLERIRAQRKQQADGTGETSKTQRRNKMEKKSPGLLSQRRPLAEVLTAKGQPMAPEQLLTEAGYEASRIEDFYLALREEIENGRIREDRPSKGNVILLYWKL